MTSSVFGVLSMDGSQTLKQGRRRFLKSGTAIERHRRSARAEGSSRGRAREGVIPPLVRGVRGISPEKFFEFNMSVEAFLMHFETIFAWGNSAYCTGISCRCIQMCFEPPPLKIEQQI